MTARSINWDRRINIAALVVSAAVLFITGYGLYLQISGDRPVLTLDNAGFLFLDLDPEEARIPFRHYVTVRASFNNTGKIPIHHGEVSVFTITTAGGQRKLLGESQIRSASGPGFGTGLSVLIPGAFGTSDTGIDVSQRFLERLLLCVKYRDPSDKDYEQPFLLRPVTGSLDGSTPLEKLPLSNQLVCKPGLHGRARGYVERNLAR
jgi:hypothetical protein